MTSETYRVVQRAVAAWLAHEPMRMDTPLEREAAEEVRLIMSHLAAEMSLDWMRASRRG